jgi:hypothetical protein
MVINEFLYYFNLDSISAYKLNGKPIALARLLDDDKTKIRVVELEVFNTTLKSDQIQILYDSDDPLILSEFNSLEKQLPTNAQYTHITMNIVTEDS